jgi:hypothetical protein
VGSRLPSNMRHLMILFAASGLASCRSARPTHSDSPAMRPTEVPAPGRQAAAVDSVVQFLLAAAAADFHSHRPPDPVRFRGVRLGHARTASGKTQYMLCGEFLPAPEGGRSAWILFATIKTSGYEQWIGAQAAGYCHGSTIIWDRVGDLSSSLQSRLASLQ